MRFIGITGGVGCGKSTLLSMLEKKKGAKVILADNLGHEVMEPGTECYEQIVTLLGSSILDETGHIKREKMAQIIYGDDEKRRQVNEIVHPSVKKEIKEQIEDNILKPNQVIASENEMCRHYDVSRVTVRKAIDELCAEGILYRIKGKGCFVRELKLSLIHI